MSPISYTPRFPPPHPNPWSRLLLRAHYTHRRFPPFRPTYIASPGRRSLSHNPPSARFDRLASMLAAMARPYDPREYELTMRQEPKQARMCGVGGKGPLLQHPCSIPCSLALLKTSQPTAGRSTLHQSCNCASSTRPLAARNRVLLVPARQVSSNLVLTPLPSLVPVVSVQSSLLCNPYTRLSPLPLV